MTAALIQVFPFSSPSAINRIVPQRKQSAAMTNKNVRIITYRFKNGSPVLDISAPAPRPAALPLF